MMLKAQQHLQSLGNMAGSLHSERTQTTTNKQSIALYV
jgi:hypothetical protein